MGGDLLTRCADAVHQVDLGAGCEAAEPPPDVLPACGRLEVAANPARAGACKFKGSKRATAQLQGPTVRVVSGDSSSDVAPGDLKSKVNASFKSQDGRWLQDVPVTFSSSSSSAAAPLNKKKKTSVMWKANRGPEGTVVFNLKGEGAGAVAGLPDSARGEPCTATIEAPCEASCCPPGQVDWHNGAGCIKACKAGSTYTIDGSCVSGPPSSWSCESSFYGSADGCDCRVSPRRSAGPGRDGGD